MVGIIMSVHYSVQYLTPFGQRPGYCATLYIGRSDVTVISMLWGNTACCVKLRVMKICRVSLYDARPGNGLA